MKEAINETIQPHSFLHKEKTKANKAAQAKGKWNQFIDGIELCWVGLVCGWCWLACSSFFLFFQFVDYGRGYPPMLRKERREQKEKERLIKWVDKEE